PLLLENGRDPYDVYAGSHQILAVCRSLALGCTRQYLARNRALGLETEVLGHTHWRWVVHTGVGFETSGLVVRAGVLLNTSVSVHRDCRWVVLGWCRKGCCRCVWKESGGWGQAGESSMGVVSREW
ncbi:hypothetical protein K443DRAFT_659932, partial [Laccaria amethystina LaAM-08-1]